MILEGIVITKNEDDSPNVAPMGPIVDRELTKIQLRPFRTSRTFANLMRTKSGVLHVTDDVDVFARAAVNDWKTLPAVVPCPIVNGWRLVDCCRWLAFQVASIDDSSDRCVVECKVAETRTVRDFFGFNRAKHAVIEAAILATRTRILPAETILSELGRLAIPVEKTAGDQERHAFQLLCDKIHRDLGVSGSQA